MDQNIKMIRIITHASAFFAPVIVPLVVFFAVTDQEIKSLALQSCIFHFIMSVLIVIAGILSFILIGIPALIVFTIIYFIVPIIGIIYAFQEKPFRYPIIHKWVANF